MNSLGNCETCGRPFYETYRSTNDSRPSLMSYCDKCNYPTYYHGSINRPYQATPYQNYPNPRGSDTPVKTEPSVYDIKSLCLSSLTLCRVYYCFYDPCASQSKFFGRKADLERHITAIHSTIELIDCEHLGCHRRGEYGVSRRDKMVEHMRDVHKSSSNDSKQGYSYKGGVKRYPRTGGSP